MVVNTERLTFHRGRNKTESIFAAQHAIAGKRSFSNPTGTVTGSASSTTYLGEFPSDDIVSIGQIAVSDYVIKSYQTPIAWRDRKTQQWNVTEHAHGQSTARHISTARQIIG